MMELVDSKRAELAQLCRRYHVKRLELFGSAVASGFGDVGDLDFLIEFQDVPHAEYANCYFGMLEALKVLFQKPIDLTETRTIRNPHFLAAIQPTREVVYAA